MIILIILSFIGVILFELPELIYRKYWWDIIVFIFLLLISFILSIFYTIGIEIPNPTNGITYVVEKILAIFK